MKRVLINLLRWGVPIAILAYLLYEIIQQGGVSGLELNADTWPLLTLSLVLVTTATVLGILRWYLLVRALSLDFSIVSALQLGFLGEMLNFVLVGSVGGDVVKMFLLARDQPGRRPQAVATVLVDRIVGLYALLLLASMGILATGLWRSLSTPVQMIGRTTLLVTVCATVGLVTLGATDWIAGPLARVLRRLPMVGPTLFKLTLALRTYRHRWRIVLFAIGMSIVTHGLLAVSVFLIASAILISPPSLGSHLVIMPLATTTGILPLPAAGLGAFEFALDKLYVAIAGSDVVQDGQGAVVALGYRLVSLLMVAVGGVVYLLTQREVGTALREASTSGEHA